MSTREICEFCNVSVKDKHTLKNHIIRNKTCLKLRGLTLDTKFICKGCENIFSTNLNLMSHIDSCKKYNILEATKELQKKLDNVESENEVIKREKEIFKNLNHKNDILINEKQQQINEKQQQIKEYERQLKDKDNIILLHQKNADKALLDAKHQIETLQKIIENIATKAVDKSNYDNNLSNYTKTEEIEIDSETSIINDDLIEIKEYKLGTTNFIVPIRSDGMIDATSLCKAGNKLLGHYLENKNTKEYLSELESDIGIPISKLIIVQKGNSKLFTQGTWVHRKVGYHLAQWISPKFALQVSNILDQLFITGKVECYENSSNIDLETQYKEKIKCLIEQNQSLVNKHISTLKTHRYIKFKETDPCFYIIESGVSCDCGQPTIQYKFGIAGNDQNTIDDRLKSHRTLWPLLKVRFLLFMKDVIMIEKSFKMMYEKEINPNGHEIIEGVTLEDMINRINKLMDMLCLKEYHIMSEEKIKEYNNYVVSTVKKNNF